MGRRALLSALSLFATSAFAQSGDQEFYRQVASVELLQSKKLQAEIKLTDAQRDKLNAEAGTYSKRMTGILDDVKAGKIGPVEAKQSVEEAKSSLKTKILATLKPEQVVRWGQLTVQQLDVLALFDPIVVAKLGLTKAQSQKLTDAWNATGARVANLESTTKKPIVDKYRAMKPANDAEREKLTQQLQTELAEATAKIKPELDKLKKEFDTSVATTLTDGQKKTWSEIKGPAVKN